MASLTVLAFALPAGANGATPADAEGARSPGSTSAAPGEALRLRKNVKALTPQERREFVKAILALKSVRSPFDPELSYYDQFVAWHRSLYPCGPGHEMMRPHGGPMFLPWHRLFLLRFENALRTVSGKRITIPYWDWTDPASTPVVFARDFMGGDGDPNNGFAVTTGPFRKGRWKLRVHPTGLQWAASASPHLTRRLGSFPVPGFDSLPSAEDVAWALERPRYDVAPYDASSDPNLSFRNALEGFWQRAGAMRVPAGSMACGPDGVMTTTSGPGPHNLVHAWVGGLLKWTPQGPRLGTMFLPTSPNDPVFFLHHANIDRLWAQWQDVHGVDSHQPASCQPAEPGCQGNTRTDPMHPPFHATPAEVADSRALGYRYASMSARPRVAEDEVVLERCKVRFAFVLGDEQAVRSRVPEKYELVRDPDTDRPLVYVSGDHCESFTVGGVSTATTVSTVAPLVESPDGTGCLSAAPGMGDLQGDALPICNGYLLWDLTDNPRYARFLRSGTPGFPVWVTDALSFEEGEFQPSLAGAPFRFRAGGSAPYSLASDFVVRDRPGGGPFVANFWSETAAGTVKLSFVLDDVEFGEAGGTVRTKPGSELAEIFGGATARLAPGLQMFTALRWSHGVGIKTVVH